MKIYRWYDHSPEKHKCRRQRLEGIYQNAEQITKPRIVSVHPKRIGFVFRFVDVDRKEIKIILL